MIRIKLLILLIILALISCGKSEYKVASQNAPLAMMSLGEGSAKESKEIRASVSNAPPPQVEVDRKLIKEATLKFATNDINKTKESIIKSVKENAGYIANEREEKYPDKINLTINIRVPADNFDKLIAGISKGVERFDERNIDVKDVTSDYIDTEARIKTKKEIEQRYIALLSKAGKVEDMLQIEEALGTIREDIESMEGQFRYMSRQIEYSDINITFYQEIAHAAQSENRFLLGFVNGWNGLVWCFIGLINIWPFVIFIAVLVFVIINIIKKDKLKKAVKV